MELAVENLSGYSKLQELYNLHIKDDVEIHYTIIHEEIYNCFSGYITAFIQKIFTILIKNQKAKIFYYSHRTFAEIINNINEYPILTLILFFNTENRVYYNDEAIDGDLSLKEQIVRHYKLFTREYLNARIENASSFQLKSTELIIPCIDTSDYLRTNGFFYNTKSFKEINSINAWVRKFLSSNGFTTSKIQTNYEKKFIHSISVLLRDLFYNTHEWGTSDHKHYDLKAGIRLAKLRLLNEESLSDEFSGYDTVLDYLNSLQQISKCNDCSESEQTISKKFNLGFIEISVLDSGVGLASKWLKKSYTEINLQEELEATQSCFLKRNTTSVESNWRSKGLGLYTVLQKLENKGFLILRTGRYCLSRNFIKSPFQKEDYTLENIFDDKKEYEHVLGTTITLVIPFYYEKN